MRYGAITHHSVLYFTDFALACVHLVKKSTNSHTTTTSCDMYARMQQSFLCSSISSRTWTSLSCLAHGVHFFKKNHVTDQGDCKSQLPPAATRVAPTSCVRGCQPLHALRLLSGSAERKKKRSLPARRALHTFALLMTPPSSSNMPHTCVHTATGGGLLQCLHFKCTVLAFAPCIP